METINVVGKEYKVSKQAKYSYYAGIVSLISTMILSHVTKSKSGINLSLLILMSIFIIIGTYATNCVTKGGCNEYGWYLAGSNILLAGGLVLQLLIEINKK